MNRRFLPAALTAIFFGGSAVADVPSVAVDIAPIHSLVTRVMQGVGEAKLVIPSGASPHEYNLRPSEARALQDADIVFWMGEDLTPWLEHAVETLAEDADVIALLDSDGTALLEFREMALFEEHDHDDHDGHDEHDDHDDHDDHHHGAHDPHAWLSPDNAANWLNVIAAKLSASDPGNAGVYFENAAAGREEIEQVKAEVSAMLEPLRGKRFVVFHDAYQYFETSFDFPSSGAISLSDATDPSPARIAEIQGRVKDESIACVLSEPQFNPAMVATVMDGTDASTGVLDPLGSNLETGADLYPQLIKGMAAVLADCLK